jgi:hypothetical protein
MSVYIITSSGESIICGQSTPTPFSDINAVLETCGDASVDNVTQNAGDGLLNLLIDPPVDVVLWALNVLLATAVANQLILQAAACLSADGVALALAAVASVMSIMEVTILFPVGGEAIVLGLASLRADELLVFEGSAHAELFVAVAIFGLVSMHVRARCLVAVASVHENLGGDE